MFLLAFFSVRDTCDYRDRYGVRYHYCHTLEIGGFRIPYEGFDEALKPHRFLSSSLDIHAYSYYYATVLLKRLGVPRGYRFALFLITGIGWEMFETYGWRTTPVSITDLIANTLGFALGEVGGERLSLVLGLQPIREYPETWIRRGEVNDGSPAYMLLGRFNTNYSPRTLYLQLNLGDVKARLGYNLGASFRKGYMYYHPYTERGIPSLYLSPDFPYLYVGKVPLPPVATECPAGGLWSYWTANLFLQVEALHLSLL